MRERRLERAAVCHGAEQLLAGAWDDHRRGEVRRAFRTHGDLPFAETSLASTERALDGYAHAWAQARSDVCEATRVRGEQSETLMDERIACLDDRKRELASLVQEFARASPKTVELSVKATESLSRVDGCTSGKASLRPLSTDPTAVARLDALREAVAEAKARADVGALQEASRTLTTALPDIHQAGDPSAPRRGRVLLGEIQRQGPEPGRAEESYLEAVWAAESGADDEHAARATSSSSTCSATCGPTPPRRCVTSASPTPRSHAWAGRRSCARTCCR